MKKCTGPCGETKPLSEFFKDKGFKDGHYSRCKKCKTAATMAWRKKNPKRYNAGAISWRDRNPDKQHAADIKRHYGITIEDYNKMLAVQNNRCALCPKEHNTKAKRGRLYVDHCHKTGQVRALLCGAHNSMLGYAEDSVEVLQKAIDYLKRFV